MIRLDDLATAFDSPIAAPSDRASYPATDASPGAGIAMFPIDSPLSGWFTPPALGPVTDLTIAGAKPPTTATGKPASSAAVAAATATVTSSAPLLGRYGILALVVVGALALAWVAPRVR